MTTPQCSTCERDLPTLESLCVSLGEDETKTCEVTAVTIHVRCVCGEDWALKQMCKGEDDERDVVLS